VRTRLRARAAGLSRVPPLVVAGSGRAGTTWLADALAAANSLRTVFEPLHPQGVPGAAPFAHRYVPADAGEPDLAGFLEEVLAGRRESLWTRYRIRPDKLRPARPDLVHPRGWKRLAHRYCRFAWQRIALARAASPAARPLYKLIRANLMLGWLERRFDARVVLLVRHPGAVVESRLRLGGPDWDCRPLIARYRADRRLGERLSDRQAALLASDVDAARGHAVLWCVENAIPLAEAGEHGYAVVHYEHLVARERGAWRAVLARLGLAHEPTAALLARPSQQTHAGGAAGDADAWTRRLTARDRDAIAEVLAEFDVHAYTMTSPLPAGAPPPP